MCGGEMREGKSPEIAAFSINWRTGKFPTISYLSLSVLVLESDNRKGFLADCWQLLCVSLKVSLQHVLTLLTAICFYPHTDMAFPSLWKESQVLGMDWWMKVMVNGSVHVDVTTQYLNVIKFITIWITAKIVVSRCAFCKLRRNFGFFCSVNHLSEPLRRHMFTWKTSKGHCLRWFVIGGFRSVWFVSVFQGSLLVIVLFRNNYNRLVCLEGFFWSFLFVSLARIKQCLPPSLRQKFHSPSRFHSPFSVLFMRAKRVQTFWFALTRPHSNYSRNRTTQTPFKVCKTH